MKTRSKKHLSEKIIENAVHEGALVCDKCGEILTKEDLTISGNAPFVDNKAYCKKCYRQALASKHLGLDNFK